MVELKSLMSLHSKTRTSFYRRLYVAWLIAHGVNTVPRIIEASGMPRRTAQDTLLAIHELDINLENSSGTYRLINWGAINETWVNTNIEEIKNTLGYP